MIWWESEPGKKFRLILHDYISNDFHEALGKIYINVNINPSVIEKWKKGGNPSLTNLSLIGQYIIDKLTKNNTFIIEDFKFIIDETRKLKNKQVLQLEAIITDYHVTEHRWVVNTYNDGVFVHGDRTGIHSYAKKLIQTTEYLAAVAKALGHTNFNITLNKDKSL